MKIFIKIFCFLFAVSSPMINGSDILTRHQIDQRLGNLNQALAGPAVSADTCFNFKNFIENARNPIPEPSKLDTINYLRELLNSTDFSDNLVPIFANTEFLSNRLLRLEIERSANPVNLRIDELKTMMVRIDTPSNGTASGTLIPITDIFNVGGAPHHSWGIITSGHILEDIEKEKKTLPIAGAEKFNAELTIGGLGIIPIEYIKVFKTNHLRVQNTIAGGGHENRGDNIVNAQDIRGIPRYEYPADLALCYLKLTPGQINVINIALLADPGVGNNYPHVQTVNHEISFQSLGGFTYNFKLVANNATRDTLVTAINGMNKRDNFILGYPSYDNFNLTLSKARPANTSLYPGFIDSTDIATRQENAFMFFHDAPTYEGMSGGPVFNTPDGTNHINIFGVVQGYNSPDPDNNAANNSLQSRCGATFILENILN